MKAIRTVADQWDIVAIVTAIVLFVAWLLVASDYVLGGAGLSIGLGLLVAAFGRRRSRRHER